MQHIFGQSYASFHLQQSQILLPWKQNDYLHISVYQEEYFISLFCLILFIYCYSLFCLIHCLKWFFDFTSWYEYVKNILTCTVLLQQQKAVKIPLNQTWSNDLVVKVLHSQCKGPGFKSTRWLEDQLSLSSFWGRSIEYLELVKK